jgi:hypothetical protein
MKLLKGHNIDRSIALFFAALIFGLDVFDIAPPEALGAITLAILSFIVIDSIEVKENISNVNEDIQKSILKLGEDLRNYTKICHSYEEVMSEVASIVSNNQNRSAEVYIYKAFDIYLERESEYFQDTIKAIDTGCIDRYSRIVSLTSPREVQNLIDVMRIFSKSDKARRQTRFYINYRPIANYISFLIVNNGDCMMSLPYLEDAPLEIRGHKCGVFVRDEKIFLSFKEVFMEIKKQDSVELVEIPSLNCPESEWQNLRDDIEGKLLKYSS